MENIQLAVQKYAMPQFQNSLNTHVVYFDIMTQVMTHISKIPNIEKLKCDMEFILHVMKVIEVLCSNDISSTTTDKKTILIEALRSSIPNISDYDVGIISNAVDFIHKSNLIVIEKTIKNMYAWATTIPRSVYKKLIRKN